MQFILSWIKIRIESAWIVSNNFHARYKALRKRYSYKIYSEEPTLRKDFVWARRDTPLNIMEMNTPAGILLARMILQHSVLRKDKDPNPIKSIQS